jgi:hypothetical protein
MKIGNKQLIVEVSERFHNDVKMVALKCRRTVKQIVIEALVNYINAQQDKSQRDRSQRDEYQKDTDEKR